ncbi:hypothetical protein [Sulfurovum sp.]|uniref:hypothetical protein n=1 Tax=Sulfurovum sp. TaxID=1969726 RepID=UPI002618BBC0|nr:hypothetical protein [Sulfurovum sp.]
MIAWLIGKGHADASLYRMDFAKTVVDVFAWEHGGEEKKKQGIAPSDNEEVLKEVFG